jgi:DNA-binding LacI/PurR family transcriptional regulator
MASRRPTIHDVARQAGVSHQTVSRVINEKEGVLAETRTRIKAIIAEMGFQPNAIARSMSKGQTHTLACIAPNLTDYTFASVIEGAENEARQRGYFLLSSSAVTPEATRDLVAELVGHRRVDGLVVINPYADERYRYIPDNFPVVFVGACSRKDCIESVSLDDEMVAYEATRHLLLLGHRVLAMVTGPMREDCSQDRSKGFRRALAEAGLRPDLGLIVEGDWSASSGQDAFFHLLEQGQSPQAVFAQNDRMAMGVIRAARQAGLRVPENLSVIGVDDMPLASYFEPPLTTMHQDMQQLGQEAARLLLSKLQDPSFRHSHVKFPAQLVIRQSTMSQKGGERHS